MESGATRGSAKEKSWIDFMFEGKIILSVFMKEAVAQERQVSNLSNEETNDYEVMGSAEGKKFRHCVLLCIQGVGAKYFFKHLGGFQLAKPDSPEYKIAVTFYEPKKSS